MPPRSPWRRRAPTARCCSRRKDWSFSRQTRWARTTPADYWAAPRPRTPMAPSARRQPWAPPRPQRPSTGGGGPVRHSKIQPCPLSDLACRCRRPTPERHRGHAGCIAAVVRRDDDGGGAFAAAVGLPVVVLARGVSVSEWQPGTISPSSSTTRSSSSSSRSRSFLRHRRRHWSSLAGAAMHRPQVCACGARLPWCEEESSSWTAVVCK